MHAKLVLIPKTLMHCALDCRFVTQLATCLTRVSGVQELWVRVEEIRAESYQQTNQAHEAALLEVCQISGQGMWFVIFPPTHLLAMEPPHARPTVD